MSAKIKPSFTADGKRYELIYTRALQCEYQRMTDEKKQDNEYRKNVTEHIRLQSKFERLQKAYLEAEYELTKDASNKKLQENYSCLEQMANKALDELNAFDAEHDCRDGDKDTIDFLEKLVVLALEEQHKLSTKDAEAVWCKYVEENGEMGAMVFLGTLGSAWFTNTNEDEDNPFIKAQMERVEAANNRRIGLQKINK